MCDVFHAIREEVRRMTEQEVKQMLIDNYANLLRIKAAETAVNKELEIQIQIAKIKLASYSISTSEIEQMILGN
jgi:methionine synthase I (cobalamin-dependent)